MTPPPPPIDYQTPDFSDERGWRQLISERLRAYWPTMPDEMKAEVAAFAQFAFEAQSDGKAP